MYALVAESKSSAYIEAVALEWARQGVDTPEKAEQLSTQYNSIYKIVASSLGLNRALADIERNFIDRWSQFGYDGTIIKEACNRTILQTGKADFNYTNGIIEGWHEKGARNMQDIEKLDAAFAKKNANRIQNKQNVNNVSKNNSFQQFPQRDYNKNQYESMEQRLLNK